MRLQEWAMVDAGLGFKNSGHGHGARLCNSKFHTSIEAYVEM